MDEQKTLRRTTASTNPGAEQERQNRPLMSFMTFLKMQRATTDGPSDRAAESLR